MELEQKLLASFKDLRRKGIQVSNKLLIKESRRIANSLGFEDFIGSYSWLDGFKRRNNICYRRPTKVSQKLKETSQKDIEEFQAKLESLVEKHKYPVDAIANFDETGVCLDMPSKRTLEFKVH
jgi:hypothetical protein